MLYTPRASETETIGTSTIFSGADLGPRLFGQHRRGTHEPDGAVATFYESCKQHRVVKPNRDLVAALLGIDAKARLEHLLALRSLDCSFDYFGPRHLMVLADFIQHVEGPLLTQQLRLHFSLVPCLQELVLRNLQLDFDVSEAASVRLYPNQKAPPPLPVKIGANEAFRYLFTALSGHPSLRRLDVSDNAIGPALLPALQRLVKMTPSLVEVGLNNCLLSTSEQAVVQSMCVLNQMREHQRRDDVVSAPHDGDESRRQQESWLRRQLSSGDAVPPRAAVSASSPPVSPYIASAGGLAVLRYHFPKEDPCVLTTACLDAVRAAFVEPALASLTVLQGRPVPRGVPGPLPHVPCTKDANTVARLVRQVSESALFRCLREHILQPPTKPPSRFAHLGATFRSSKEDYYEHILATQHKQWELLVGQVVQTMVPSMISADATLFRPGEEAYWLTFVPRSETGAGSDTGGQVDTWVEVSPAEDGSEAGAITSGTGAGSVRSVAASSYRVRAGQFVGEDDLLDAPGHYAADKYDVSAATSKRTAVRSCCARVKAIRGAAPNEPTAAQDEEVAVWQMPRDVAHFFLSTPFRALHKRTAHALKLFPALHSTPAPLLARVAYALRPVGITALELRDAQGIGSDGEERDPRLQATGSELAANIYLLEEGEFYLGHATAKGSWTEKCLEGGLVVMNKVSLSLDVAARGDGTHLAGLPDENGTRGPRGEKLGKNAFERQYREARRHQQSSPTATSAPSGDADATAGAEGGAAVNRAAFTTPTLEAALSLGGSSSHWKYYVVTNEDFVNLPQCVRLALTTRYIPFDA